MAPACGVELGGSGSSLPGAAPGPAGCLQHATSVWELDDSATTRVQRRWLGGAGRPLLRRRPGGGSASSGSSRAGGSGSLGSLPAATRFASIAASGLAAGGQRVSADGLQAVPAGVVEGEPWAAWCVDARSERSARSSCSARLSAAAMPSTPPRARTTRAGAHQRQYAWDGQRLRALEPEDWADGEAAVRSLRGRLRRAAHDLRAAFFPNPAEVSPGAQPRCCGAAVCRRLCLACCQAPHMR